MRKIGFVVPWFGEKIPGGAEMETRSIVSQLSSSNIEIEILTTCIKEFSTDWNKNFYKEKETIEMGVPVKRFLADPVNVEKFGSINSKLMRNEKLSLPEEDVFLSEMIHSTNMLKYMETHKDDYEFFVFIPYMFGTTYWGCQVCPEKSILIPCFHDESYAHMIRFKEAFSKVRGMIFNAQPEMELANKLYDLENVHQINMGIGMNTDIICDPVRFRKKYDLKNQFILYAGRKDEGKNIGTLLTYFAEYKKRNNNDLKLVLIGGGKINIPSSIVKDVYDLGFLDIQDKYDAYAAAELLCQPSYNESFSLVIMESWLCKKPVLVHGRCEVTKHFVIDSNGGLYFNRYFEFEGAINYIVKHKKEAIQMGMNGNKYVQDNFSISVIVEKYNRFFNDIIEENIKKAKESIVEKSKIKNNIQKDLKKSRIAFVNQRYGLEVNGGSEYYTRIMAEHLSNDYDVEILTTKAVDYVDWKNYYTEDLEKINNVIVRRFSVDKPRDMKAFEKYNDKIYHGHVYSPSEEEKWVDMQGPYCPKLINYISVNKDKYDVFIFVTYLYYLTVRGIECVSNKSILIPTAHDEPFINFKIYEKVFRSPKGIIYLTDEEEKLVKEKFENSNIEHVVIGIGVDIPEKVGEVYFRKKYEIDNDYIIYVGRIDATKGCYEMFDNFIRYKMQNPVSKLKLILMGKAEIPIPLYPDIIYLGFVSEEDKYNGIVGAKALILPSCYESLSISVLESMALGVPILVNGACDVLKGHCIKSNAGLYYMDYFEFETCLNYLLTHKEEYEQMKINAEKYIHDNFIWDKIIEKFRKMIEYVGGVNEGKKRTNF